MTPPTEAELEELRQLADEVQAMAQAKRLAIRARAELELRRRRRLRAVEAAARGADPAPRVCRASKKTTCPTKHVYLQGF
jgi:hypothetical protein